MSRTYYVNGSAVRELETQPLRRPERPDRRKIEEEQRKKRRRNAARRNRERELGMSKGYVLFLSACVTVTIMFEVIIKTSVLFAPSDAHILITLSSALCTSAPDISICSPIFIMTSKYSTIEHL